MIPGSWLDPHRGLLANVVDAAVALWSILTLLCA